MNILVTGAGGQLGFEVVRRLRYEYEAFNITAADEADLDICSLEEVCSSIKGVDTVINCAAFTNVDLCEEKPDAAFRVNCEGVKNLAFACNKENAVLFHISTDYVFDGNKAMPYTEDDLTNPQTVYGKSKLAGEKEAEKCRKHFILRTSWLYGENGKNFVKTMLRLAETEECVKVVDDQLGTPTSAFDLARVICRLTESTDYGIYHCTGNGQAVSWFEFTKEIFKIRGIKTPVLPCSSAEFNAKAKRPLYSVLENRRLKESGIDVMRDWKIALKDFLNERNEIL